jgi:glutamate dehydrogenase (NAD(P)+)
MENQNANIVSQLEEMTGNKISDEQKKLIVHGPDEIDLVRSGLEDTMIKATKEILDCWKQNPTIIDMRTAAFVVAINKVGTSYLELGIFP